ncbi:MAG: hypothetical protein AAF721_07120 [Myxococcota bacterium]
MAFWKRRRPEDSGAADIRSQLAQLAQRAQEALARREWSAVLALTDEGFELAERHAVKDDVVFVALLPVAGDGAFAVGEVESELVAQLETKPPREVVAEIESELRRLTER